MDARYDFVIPISVFVFQEATGMKFASESHAQAGLTGSSVNIASVIKVAPWHLRACIISSAFFA